MLAKAKDRGPIWMGRSRSDSGDHPFERLLATADTWAALPDIDAIETIHARVLGVLMDFNRLREVVLWVDTRAEVDVSVTQVNQVPGLLVRGADRIALVASCEPGTMKAMVIL